MAIVTREDLLRNDVSMPTTIYRAPATNTDSLSIPDGSAPAADTPLTDAEVTAHRMWIGYGVLGVILVAYLVSLLVRSPAQDWTWLDGWTVCGIEVVASLMCVV